MNRDGVTIREEVVRVVMLCVQHFVRDLVFTQRNFFSETGVTRLPEATALSDSITSSSLYAPWSKVGSKSTSQVIGDLNTYFENALDRRHVNKETSEQCYVFGPVQSSSSELPSQYGVRISTIMEEALILVDYVPVVAPSCTVADPSRHHSSPRKG